MLFKKKVIKGSIWILFIRIGINVVDFLVYVYFVCVLILEEFGLVGFCFLFIEFVNMFVNVGVN